MKVATLNEGKVEFRDDRPRIFKRAFGVWYCGGMYGKFGMGYTPVAAYNAWYRNCLQNLRNPE